MNLGSRQPRRTEGLGEPLSQPHHGAVHIVSPTIVASWEDDVDPYDLTGEQQNGASTTSATNDFDTCFRTRYLISNARATLRRPEHQRRGGDLMNPDLWACRMRDFTCMKLAGGRPPPDQRPLTHVLLSSRAPTPGTMTGNSPHHQVPRHGLRRRTG